METAARGLQTKFDAARSLLERSAAAGVGADVARALANELGALELRLALSTGHLYLAPGETGRLAASADYARILAAEDFAGAVDDIVARAEGAFRAAGVALREGAPEGKRGKASPARPAPAAAKRRVAPQVSAEIQRLLDTYPKGGARQGALQVNYESCPACGGEMSVDAGRSELRCCDEECGAVRELVGTVFDDSQFYSQEGQKAKSGTFNPNRHFQHWWMHILAREPEEEIGDKEDPDNQYGEKTLEALRTIVARDRRVLRLLTVNDVRAMLREINRTDLNKNVPLILKKLTGIGPPQVSEAVAVRTENLFTKAIEIGERVRRSGRVNRNYYPFYIYKVLDHLLEPGDTETRRILFYIYIQSKETVEADDEDWEQICLELEEIKYVPTDRTKMMQYQVI